VITVIPMQKNIDNLMLVNTEDFIVSRCVYLHTMAGLTPSGHVSHL